MCIHIHCALWLIFLFVTDVVTEEQLLDLQNQLQLSGSSTDETLQDTQISPIASDPSQHQQSNTLTPSEVTGIY